MREARWAARLRGSVPFSRLLYAAACYAIEEQVADALAEPFDTTSLDLYMLCLPDDNIIRNKVQFDARRLGIISSSKGLMLPREKQSWAEDRLNRDLMYMDLPVSKAIEKISGAYWIHEEELSDDADTLYALWLRKLSESQKWEELSTDSRDELAKRLFDEVKEIYTKAESQGVPWLNRYPEVMSWQPSSDLLEEAGVSLG